MRTSLRTTKLKTTRLVSAAILILATIGVGSSVAAEDPPAGLIKAVPTIQIEAGKHDRVNVPIRVDVGHFVQVQDPPPGSYIPTLTAGLQAEDGTVLAGHLASTVKEAQKREQNIITGRAMNDLHFILPSLKAGEKLSLRLITNGKELQDLGLMPSLPPGVAGVPLPPPGTVDGIPVVPPAESSDPQPPSAVTGLPVHLMKGFTWTGPNGEFKELRFNGRPVVRYINKPYDNTTGDTHQLTKKVFHHVFDPTGKQIITKGPGGLYSHHRGLFYGFSKMGYGEGKTADLWHCNYGESQRHVKVLRQEFGSVVGRHQIEISWHGKDAGIIAREHRMLSAFNVPGGTLLEFESRLRSEVGPLTIDGDPQHAGFQFRASQELADKTKDQTYYLRPDGRDKPGVTRNWGHKTIGEEINKKTENLPWNAMSFVVGGKRYTAVYLDHPGNPKPARYSERDYGRFGSYFETKLDEDDELAVRYRVWIQEGEMTVNEAARLSADFVDPPQAKFQFVAPGINKVIEAKELLP